MFSCKNNYDDSHNNQFFFEHYMKGSRRLAPQMPRNQTRLMKIKEQFSKYESNFLSLQTLFPPHCHGDFNPRLQKKRISSSDQICARCNSKRTQCPKIRRIVTTVSYNFTDILGNPKPGFCRCHGKMSLTDKDGLDESDKVLGGCSIRKKNSAFSL